MLTSLSPGLEHRDQVQLAALLLKYFSGRPKLDNAGPACMKDNLNYSLRQEWIGITSEGRNVASWTFTDTKTVRTLIIKSCVKLRYLQ